MDIIWPTLLLVGVLAALTAVVLYARSVLTQDKKERRSFNMDMVQMAKYIKKTKAKEQEAWSNAMTLFSNDHEVLNTMYGDYDDKQDTGRGATKSNANTSVQYMQQAFFAFWKIPDYQVPKAPDEANKFIETYKERLKAEGYIQRVRRWSRLELLMARFCAEFDVERLERRSYVVGINKPILIALLELSLQMLEQKQVHWKDVSGVDAYRLIVARIQKVYPKLNLLDYRLK
ncbi:hypothetical protein [Saezia sanguinis]|uniref:hypothetical protein n=1 Tax=Saezia sanguinis TaxID=1965230 RepID=UPI00303AA18A